MSKLSLTLGLVAAAAAGPAAAARIDPDGLASAYVRARAAEINGDAATARATLGELMAREPGNAAIATRALRQGMLAGDEKLAVRAARTLDASGTLPADIRPLLAIEAIKQRDWKAALIETGKIEQDRGFAFLAPYLRAWIAVGSRQGDPLAMIETARNWPIGAPYVGEQRALVLVALGRTEEGVAAFRALDTHGIGSRPAQLRLLFADALAKTGQKQRALDLIDGDDPVMAAARARIAAGRRLPAPLDGPLAGIATLLLRVAVDFDRQRLAPIALTLARYATFADPDNASAWLVAADLLADAKATAPALDAVTHIAADDPAISLARAMRIRLLATSTRTEEALAEAKRATERGDADVGAWQQLGQVYMTLARPADAAPAYRKAIDAAIGAHVPADGLWPLWLQYGSALDQAGDWAGAKTALQQALTLAPNEAVVLNQLGYSQVARRDDVAAATALIERASKLRPDDAAITDSLGWVRYLGGDAGAAVPLLEKASAADPGEPTINEHLGDAYWQLGRALEARYAWRAALVTAEDKDRARLAAKIDIGLTPATAAP